MARMGGQRRLKALNTPAFWPILRKKYKWTVKPRAGPHPSSMSLPLLIIVRNVLGLADTAREARKIIAEGHIEVDGRIRKDYKYPVGIMDVVRIRDTGEAYRLIPYPVKFFALHPIDGEEAKYKLSLIKDKTTVKRGDVQLNLHDGRNVLIRVQDPRNPVEDKYKTLGSLKITIPEQEVVEYYPFEEGAIAIITGGRNVGRVGRIVEYKKGIRLHRSVVTIEDVRGSKFQTSMDYIFVIGRDKPEISLPEGAWK
ncbi:MAG: 30S ribosomal protein S4e [Desulfurococcales archaeon]|nr:30S ribosomal protein S4e [Desulfurococcales archaeon]